ncbi:MAG: helix-turn-helix transcriptional regulator [Candidatus Marinimicrobia bacterium]|nr:helix-turn-helix transcriptional regulator [Candidatus Neomarinimicrobiota bacterium]
MDEKVRNKVKDYRIKQDLTQQDLATLSGVSRQSINSIEKEKYIPSLPLALKLAKIFKCKTDELFSLED